MFGVSGAALSKIRHMQNGGKRARHSVDQWDRQSTWIPRGNHAAVGMLTFATVMDRDRRLTGYLRGQTDQVQAPAGFELSNGWRVRRLSRLGEMRDFTDSVCRSRSVSCKSATRCTNGTVSRSTRVFLIVYAVPHIAYTKYSAPRRYA